MFGEQTWVSAFMVAKIIPVKNYFSLLISFVKVIDPYLQSYTLVFVPHKVIVTIIIIQKLS